MNSAFEIPAFEVSPVLRTFADVRSTTSALVADLDQALSERAPAPGKWSAGEVLDHLRLFDLVIAEEIEELVTRWSSGRPAFVYRRLSDVGVALPGVPPFLQPLLEFPLAFANAFVPRPLRAALLRSREIPAQAPERTVPRRGASIDELRAVLGAFPGRLQALLDANPGLDLKRLRYYSPISGFTDAVAFLDLLSNHERRHQGQLRDILAAVTAAAGR